MCDKKLELCIYCGQEMAIIVDCASPDGAYVMCNGCHAKGPTIWNTNFAYAKDQAIKRWNATSRCVYSKSNSVPTLNENRVREIIWDELGKMVETMRSSR